MITFVASPHGEVDSRFLGGPAVMFLREHLKRGPIRPPKPFASKSDPDLHGTRNNESSHPDPPRSKTKIKTPIPKKKRGPASFPANDRYFTPCSRSRIFRVCW